MEMVNTTSLNSGPTGNPLRVKERAASASQPCSESSLTSLNPVPQGINLRALAPFDTIRVRTRNSDYRIFLLDPETGRALVESGTRFIKPVEWDVIGSTFDRSTFEIGWLAVGLRIEMCSGGNYLLTSPVQSLNVEHLASANTPEAISD